MTTPELVQAQRTYFETGATRSAEFRLAALKKLQAAVQANERALAEAMAAGENRVTGAAQIEADNDVIRSLVDQLVSAGEWPF